jgi:quinolinate synthase
MTLLQYPKEYEIGPVEELTARIRAIKDREGANLTILGHHYQREQIVRLSDIVGDSFILSQKGAQSAAKTIVFCGVRFMAESARVLARPDQIVQHPDFDSGCPMADMADLNQVELAWNVITGLQPGRNIIPVTYMNSNVDLKAFCGRHGGIVCTSSNADRVFDWAYAKGDTILFFPDEHLGRNTANARGMNRNNIEVWDPAKASCYNEYTLSRAELVLWKGYCHVHRNFTADHVRQLRREYPSAFIIVHPECPEEVVALSDAAGSTADIVRRVEKAKPGEVIGIGTESRLVERLAGERRDLTILPLAVSRCGNMSKITLGRLLWTLEHLGEFNVVEVDPETSRDAKLSLDRMLELV